MDHEVSFQFDGNKLVRNEMIDENYSRSYVVLTKEVFLECYNKWVKEKDNDHTSSKTKNI